MAQTSPPSPPADKRKASRLTAPKVVVRIPSVDRFRTHYLKDISEGGLFVKAEKVLPAGAMLSLELWPPGWDQALEIAGKVARSVDPATAAAEGRPCGMAVRFVNVPPEVDRQLQALVEEHGHALEDRSAGADPVGAQVEAVVRELAAARERLGQLDSELAEARGQSEAFTEQIHKLEQEESEARTATARAEGQRDDLARRLAADTAKLTAERDDLQRRLEKEASRSAQLGGSAAELQRKLDKEVARAGQLTAERDDLQRKLAEAVARTEAEQARSKEQIEVITAEFEALTHKLAKERDETRAQRERADRLTRDLEKRDARERGLRSLLDRVSGQSAHDAAAGSQDDDEVVVVGSEPASDELDHEEGVSPPPARSAADGVEKDGAAAASASSPDVDLDFDLDDLGLDDQSVDAEEEGGAFDAVVSEADEKPVGAAAGGALPEVTPDGLESFNATLRPRTRLMAGEKLADHAPSGEEEALVIELLGASPTFGTLINQLEGRVSEEHLRRMLCLLYSGALIDLRN